MPSLTHTPRTHRAQTAKPTLPLEVTASTNYSVSVCKIPAVQVPSLKRVTRLPVVTLFSIFKQKNLSKQNSKLKTLGKFKNLNWDETLQLRLWWNSNCNEAQKLKLWWISKTQIGIKLKNSNCYETTKNSNCDKTQKLKF